MSQAVIIEIICSERTIMYIPIFVEMGGGND